MPDDIQTLLARIETAMADAKVVIRQAHEATADLQAATTEAREVKRTVTAEIEPKIRAEVTAKMKTVASDLDQEISDAVEQIKQNFKMLQRRLFEGGQTTPPLPYMVAAAVVVTRKWKAGQLDPDVSIDEMVSILNGEHFGSAREN